MRNERIEGDGRAARWLGLYTLLYLCGALTLVMVMVACRKLLIWNMDGVKQHYTVLGYVGQVVRDLFAGRAPRMLSFSLGQGMDVLTTCSYYGYTDPLSLLAALVGPEKLEYAYVGIALLRNYLAGLCFAVYAKKLGAKNGWALGCSAAIYVYGGFFLYLLGRHPYFLNGALYLPLMLLGIERVFGERRWLLYVLVTALMLVVNFYFAYINTVLAVLYIVIRLISRLPGQGVKRCAADGLTLLGGYLLGLAISAVVFYPMALAYLGNGRLGVETGYAGSMLRYSTWYYRQMAENAFLSWRGGDVYTYLNFVPPALLGLLGLLTVRGKRSRMILLGLLVCLVGASVPLFGKLMNGMHYVVNRWIYALGLFVALGCCFGLPKALRPGKALRVLAALAALYGLALAWPNRKSPVYLAEALLLSACAALVAFGGQRDGWLNRQRTRRLITASLALTIALYSAMPYLPIGAGYIEEQSAPGLYDRLASESKGHLIGDDGVYRVDQPFFDDANSLLFGYNGTSLYWSVVNGGIAEYYIDLWLPALVTADHVYGFYGNTPMNAVAAVKYSVQGADSKNLVPYGFDLMDEPLALPDGAEARVCRNEYALPLGYAYDRQLLKADYDALPVEEKLAALTRYAIVERAGEALPVAAPDELAGAATELSFTMTASDGATMADGRFQTVDGGRLTLTFDAPEDCEVYLLADNIRVNAAPMNLWLRVTTESGGCDSLLRRPEDNYCFPRKGLALCLGHDAPKGCEVLLYKTPEASGEYDGLRLVALPLSAYRDDMAARRSEGMTDVRLGKDSLTGKIAVSGDRVLQIAVPYSEGWRAWVDGVEQKVFRCGGMYMGVEIGAGAHEIEMRYVTPGLKVGLAVSCAALLVTAVLAVLSAARRRRERKGA